ncbi:MAG: SMC family ATPase [Nitrososphaeria archaeon]
MKITKILAENLKVFPRLELNLEDYKVVLITGPNGSGKTTAFVTIPIISFFNEFNEFSLKDLSLPSREGVIVLEFEHEGKRYAIERKYTDKVSRALLYSETDRKKITKFREIEGEIERIFGMDARTFLSTVVIAQGQVETLSEKSPRERRELFLRFLEVDFKRAYDKAKDELDLITPKIDSLKDQIERLRTDLKEKQPLENLIQSIKNELKGLDNQILVEEKKRNALVKEKEEVSEELKRLHETLGQIKELSKKLDALERETEEFVNRVGKIDKGELESKIKKTSDDIKTLQDTYVNIENKLKLEQTLSMLKELFELENKVHELPDIERRLRELNTNLGIKEVELLKANETKAEYETKRKASTIYLKNVKNEFKCPVCETDLSSERQVKLVEKLTNEINSYPEKVKELTRTINDLDREISLLKEEISELNIKYSQSIDAKRRFDKEVIELDDEYRGDVYSSIQRVREKLDNLERKIEDDLIKVNLNILPNQRTTSFILRKERELDNEKDRLQKALEEYKDYEKKIEEKESTLKKKQELSKDLERVEELTKKEEQLKRTIQEVEDRIEQLKGEKRSKTTNLEVAQINLGKLMEEERLLQNNEDEMEELRRKREIYSILKERVFHTNAFPVEYLREFVQMVQANLSDFISKFKGGKYEIDIGVTGEGDIEVRARDRSKIDNAYRPLSTFSQGERTIIGFAIRLATMSAISQYKGKNMPNILIVDEGFGPLDQENMKVLIEGIKELSSIFEQIFIITHIEQLKEEFSQKLVVIETERGSIIKPE